MKKCPYCAEDILDEAIKCKHCGSELPQKEPTTQKEPPPFIGKKDKKALKWIGKALLVVLAVFVWYISIPVVLIWYIWKKSKLNKKKKYIGTILAIILFIILTGFYFYLNRIPSLANIKPNDGFTIQSNETTIKGAVNPKDATLNINGTKVKTENGKFNYEVKLPNKKNEFILKVSNSNGQSKQKITINRIFTETEKQAAIETQKEAEEARKKAEEERKAEQERKAKEEAEKQAAIEAQKEAEQKAWEQSKAGQICKAHPEWTKIECAKLANNKIWIGMTLDMLKYMRGLPNSSNPSNYGSGIEWQWCWHNYTPSCFYGDDDKIIDSYN